MGQEKHVLTYATGNLKTIVTECETGSFRWRRSASRGSQTKLALPSEDIRQAVVDASTGAVRFVFPVAYDGTSVYEVPDAVSIAWKMMAGITVPADHIGLVHAVGKAVRQLHDTAPPPNVADRPPALAGVLAEVAGRARWARS